MAIVMLDDVDLSMPAANRLDYLFWLKGKYPSFKCSLFIIPMRSTWQWIKELEKIEWLEICMHGYNHDVNEEITSLMLHEWGNYYGFPKIYKGPEWHISKNSEEILKSLGFKIIDISYKDNNFQGHIWVKTDLDRLRILLENGLQCKHISE